MKNGSGWLFFTLLFFMFPQLVLLLDGQSFCPDFMCMGLSSNLGQILHILFFVFLVASPVFIQAMRRVWSYVMFCILSGVSLTLVVAYAVSVEFYLINFCFDYQFGNWPGVVTVLINAFALYFILTDMIKNSGWLKKGEQK